MLRWTMRSFRSGRRSHLLSRQPVCLKPKRLSKINNDQGLQRRSTVSYFTVSYFVVGLNQKQLALYGQADTMK